MRTVTVVATVKLTIRSDEGVEISKVINELDYHFSDTTTQAEVEDSVIEDYEIIDSR